MARISGVNIPLKQARVRDRASPISTGSGRPTSQQASGRGLGIEPGSHKGARPHRGRGRQASVTCHRAARSFVEGDLRRQRLSQEHQAVLQGDRFATCGLAPSRRGLPVRGPETRKTNARTRKGPKRMQVAGKKKAGK